MQQRSPLRGTARWLVVVAAAALALAACSKDVDPDQALKQGLAQQQAGNLEEAAGLYQQVLDARPGDKYANYNLGVIEQHDGRSEVAEGYYRAALDADPNFVPALFNLAIVRTGVGATQEAMDLYRRVIALEPNTAAAYLNLGLLYRGCGPVREGRRPDQQGARARSVARGPSGRDPHHAGTAGPRLGQPVTVRLTSGHRRSDPGRVRARLHRDLPPGSNGLPWRHAG